MNLNSENSIIIHKNINGDIIGVSFKSKMLPFQTVVERKEYNLNNFFEFYRNEPETLISEITLKAVKIASPVIRSTMADFLKQYSGTDIHSVTAGENCIEVIVHNEKAKLQIPKTINGVEIKVTVI
ncbi:MAG TPA: hypothetical protein PLP33_30340 [Leptospiraceae bacterium]|nr:hypothetical protein [Leptospiraceae bacterium]